MKSFVTALILAAAFIVTAPAEEKKAANEGFYSHSLLTIDGKNAHLKDYKGKVLLVVTVASQCGATPQYTSLVQLQSKYGKDGLVVIGVPTNDFGGQDPGSNKEIKAFCTNEYQVNFPMMAKIPVSGDDQHPLFKELTSSANRDFTGPIQWNFEKFIIGKDGLLLRRFRTDADPADRDMVNAIEEALQAPAPADDSGCEGC